MKLEDIENLWEQDCKIDPTELGKESLKIPELHNKYFKIFTQEKLLLKKLEQDYKFLYKQKFEYYMGIMDEGELRTNGWEPNPLKILKQDLPVYMESDNDLVTITKKVELQREKINFLESIIKNIINRGFLIKNAIDWNKFQVGA